MTGPRFPARNRIRASRFLLVSASLPARRPSGGQDPATGAAWTPCNDQERAPGGEPERREPLLTTGSVGDRQRERIFERRDCFGERDPVFPRVPRALSMLHVHSGSSSGTQELYVQTYTGSSACSARRSSEGRVRDDEFGQRHIPAQTRLPRPLLWCTLVRSGVRCGHGRTG